MKKSSRRLRLKRETLSTLNRSQLNALHGGTDQETDTTSYGIHFCVEDSVNYCSPTTTCPTIAFTCPVTCVGF